MLLATLEFSQRWSPHWWDGPMRSAPACAKASSAPLEPEIAREAKRWWTEP